MRRPQPGNRRVDEGRVVMAVHHPRPVIRGDARDGPSEVRPEAVTAPQGSHADVLLPEALSPAAFFIEAADRHRQLGSKPSHELDDEPLSSTGVEAQNHLENLGRLAGRCVHGYAYR